MHLKLQNLRLFDVRQLLAISVVVLILCAVLASVFFGKEANAATASTINFQARLMNAAGAIAPDGNYNVEFKLYDTESTGGTAQGTCTGNCVWMETRTGANVITVANGYVTVNLGSVTSFGSSINWDQDLWLTMNIGGTSGTPSWDGEMSPRLKLTAVPYAFRAAKLASLAGSFTGVLQFAASLGQDSTVTLPDPGAGTATVCYQNDSACGFLTSSATDFIQNQNSSQQATANFWISGTGRADTALQAPLFDTPTATTLEIGTTNATAITLAKNTTVASGMTLTVTSGLTSLTGNATTGDALHVSNSTSTGNIAVFSDDSTAVLTIADGGSATFRNSVNSANAFGVENSSGVLGFNLDTATSTNLITNHSIETDTSGWSAKGSASISRITSAAFDNTASLQVTTTGTGDGATYSYSLASNTQYTFSFYVERAPSGFFSTLEIGRSEDGSTDTSCATGQFATSSNWGRLKCTFTTGTVSGSTYLYVKQADATARSFYIDAVQLETAASATQYRNVQASINGNLIINGGNLTDTATSTLLVRTNSGGDGLVVKGNGDNNIFQNVLVVSSADDTALLYVNDTSKATVVQGGSSFWGTAALTALSTDTGAAALKVKAASGQTANILNVTDNSDAVLFSVGASGVLTAATLGTADTSTYICRNSSNQFATCSGSIGDAFVQGGNTLGADAVMGTNDAYVLQFETNNTIRATFDTSNNLYLGNGITAASPNNFVISGTGSSTTSVNGGTITLQGGDATVGNASGGDLLLSGGAGVGTGVSGLVVLGTPTVSVMATDANCGATTAVDCTVAMSTVDNYGSVILGVTADNVTITMPDPTNSTAGRIFYFTASAASTSDFELALNSGGTLIEVAMKANATATLIWNGSDWTVGGASSSTTLQAAYDNTLSSAGGAEIILNNTATSNGLTVRNNPTSPIIGGGLLEVQTSIGTNLFSVNNNISELVANGGAEDSSTFSTDWTALGSSTISRNTTSGQYATGTAGVSVAATTAAGDGVRNNLASSPATSTTYMISFTAMLASGAPAFTDMRVDYTPTGASTGTQCIASQTLVSTDWTRVTCEVVTPATAVTDPDILVYQVGAPGSARTFYIDNLSMTLADDAGGIPNNVQIGGGIYGGAPTLFTLDRSAAPPVANNNETYLGSMYYDTTSGRIQCYEADGWGACGSAPNNIITLTPEYTGAVLNGTGVGTLSADFCANETGVLSVGTLCASGMSRNFYEWTSPQATMQTYSIYVSYKLPSTFKSFDSANTITLTWLTTSASGTDGYVSYQVFRSTGSAITSCDGSTETTETTPSANTWYTTAFNGDETACGFSGGDNIIFKINVKAKSNANVYVENLNFTYSNT